jgi:hypothetical protein
MPCEEKEIFMVTNFTYYIDHEATVRVGRMNVRRQGRYTKCCLQKIYMERPMQKEENNIKMNLEEIGCRDVNWIELIQDRCSCDDSY